jgi:hypothetical protein
MRRARNWLLLGAGLLVFGVLPLLEGGARTGVIVAGGLVTLVAGVQMLKDQDDDDLREPPCPPGGRSSV